MNQSTNATELYFTECANHKILTESQERKALALAKAGNKNAFDYIIIHNQRLVISVAKKYMNSRVRGTNELIDLIQFGNMGLIEAIKRYDESFKTRFATYAYFWIKTYIRRHGTRAGLQISTSYQGREDITTVHKLINKMTHELNRDPSIYELSKKLGCTERRIKTAMDVSVTCQSLDQQTDDGKSYNENLTYESSETPEEIAEMSSNIDYLKIAISKLEPKRKYVLLSRFGLFGHDKKTYQQLSCELKVTRQRIQQIEQDTINKLKIMLT